MNADVSGDLNWPTQNKPVKRARQAEKHRQQNAGHRSMMRTEVKKVIKAMMPATKSLPKGAFKSLPPLLDSMATKGLIHKNKAARHKSRLNAKIRAL